MRQLQRRQYIEPQSTTKSSSGMQTRRNSNSRLVGRPTDLEYRRRVEGGQGLKFIGSSESDVVGWSRWTERVKPS
jgi:hypothetical protein